MNEEYCKFTVKSTWSVNEGNVTIEEIVSVENVNDSEWMQLDVEEIGHLNQLENDENFKPLQMIRQNKNETCTLTLNIEDPTIQIAKLTVISEARIIELYGKHGEYVCTEKGHQIGCVAGKNIYIAQTNVFATEEVSLKFCTNDDCIWLYGITLFIARSNESSCNSKIDYAKVEQMLRSSNIHLSENAEQAKAFIMSYNNNENNDLRNLHGYLRKWNALEGNSKTLLSNILPIVTNNGNASVLKNENGNPEEDSNVNDFKNYVDEKIQQLEERVKNNLQITLKEFEQKQSEKLDNIIQLLQKK